ncbi:hypothetical protein BDN70DRAFT_890693 [Pholiota conissans]|uniref:Uncharacterized protein n=1 Tax=Pholiota conissans TaxID=109636 RepID=A0A9P6D5S2_9AGAR|nr:hypothetical protein BDN70DRAFT_890693 [Pholiota conissans]
MAQCLLLYASILEHSKSISEPAEASPDAMRRGAAHRVRWARECRAGCDGAGGAGRGGAFRSTWRRCDFGGLRDGLGGLRARRARGMVGMRWESGGAEAESVSVSVYESQGQEARVKSLGWEFESVKNDSSHCPLLETRFNVATSVGSSRTRYTPHRALDIVFNTVPSLRVTISIRRAFTYSGAYDAYDAGSRRAFPVPKKANRHHMIPTGRWCYGRTPELGARFVIVIGGLMAD